LGEKKIRIRLQRKGGLPKGERTARRGGEKKKKASITLEGIPKKNLGRKRRKRKRDSPSRNGRNRLAGERNSICKEPDKKRRIFRVRETLSKKRECPQKSN